MIQLGNIKRSDKNLTEHGGIYKKETDERYYNFNQIEAINKELDKQGMRIPTIQDLLDSGFTKEWTKENKILADNLGLKHTGYCNSGGDIYNRDEYSYLRSSSLFKSSSDTSWEFKCLNEKGVLYWNNHSYCFPLRPVLKNSISDNLSIGLFETIVNRAEKYGAKLGAIAGYELGKILSDNK